VQRKVLCVLGEVDYTYLGEVVDDKEARVKESYLKLDSWVRKECGLKAGLNSVSIYFGQVTAGRPRTAHPIIADLGDDEIRRMLKKFVENGFPLKVIETFEKLWFYKPVSSP